jgi:hypothetical protein
MTQHWQVIDLFIASADQLYGPITTLRSNGKVVKKIPWSAFKLSNRDWMRVADARNILAVHIHILLLDSSLLLLIGLNSRTASVFSRKMAYVMACTAPD